MPCIYAFMHMLLMLLSDQVQTAAATLGVADDVHPYMRTHIHAYAGADGGRRHVWRCR